MAKTQIHQQKEALEVYFRDMLMKLQPSPAKENRPQSESVTDSAASLSRQSMAPTAIQAVETTPPLKLLLCEIGGIKLAIPVSGINNIIHWPASGLHQIPNPHDWQLGLLQDRGKHVEVIDIRRPLQAPESSDPAYILLMNQSQYGIVCDRISRIVNIEENHINWRHDQSHRPWFTGVIADSMHSIVDVPALLADLKRGEMA